MSVDLGWMSALDNQLKSSALPSGLATFAPCSSREAPWDNWRQWPHVTISLDLGSDGLSGYKALERKFKLSCDKIQDASHAANRDMILSLQQSGLYSLWLCLLINNNLPFGPKPGFASSSRVAGVPLLHLDSDVAGFVPFVSIHASGFAKAL